MSVYKNNLLTKFSKCVFNHSSCLSKKSASHFFIIFI
nr:MAG TPA: hypothetical protein [Caudoviricetes sp.]